MGSFLNPKQVWSVSSPMWCCSPKFSDTNVIRPEVVMQKSNLQTLVCTHGPISFPLLFLSIVLIYLFNCCLVHKNVSRHPKWTGLQHDGVCKGSYFAVHCPPKCKYKKCCVAEALLFWIQWWWQVTGHNIPCHWHSWIQRWSCGLSFQSHALGSKNQVAVLKHRLKFPYISCKFPI